MKTLVLLRHAKSTHDQAHLDDHDRSLAPRGTTAAPLIGQWLAARVAPDLVLVSSAVRTQRTWALAAPAFTKPLTASTREDLYLAEPAALLTIIRASPNATSTLLIIGHNPGLHLLAMRLAGHGKRSLREALAEKFPSAAAAILTFDVSQWSDIDPGRGTLAAFTSPKRLAADDSDDA
jgi:phosphohistidine phosphatase